MKSSTVWCIHSCSSFDFSNPVLGIKQAQSDLYVQQRSVNAVKREQPALIKVVTASLTCISFLQQPWWPSGSMTLKDQWRENYRRSPCAIIVLLWDARPPTQCTATNDTRNRLYLYCPKPITELSYLLLLYCWYFFCIFSAIDYAFSGLQIRLSSSRHMAYTQARKKNRK